MEKPHKTLKAWQLSMDIAVDVYKISDQFPSDERFGLVSQILSGLIRSQKERN